MPRSAPLVLEERPVGHVVAIGLDEQVFSARMARKLLIRAKGEMGKVIFEGRTLPDWHRIFLDVTCDVLDPEALHEYRCRGCGTSHQGTQEH